MPRLPVRTLCSEDFGALRQREADVYGATGDDVLCPHYLRMSTEFYGHTCFLALADDRPAGSLLCFVRGWDACCTTLAVRTEFQRTRVTPMLGASEAGTHQDFYCLGGERSVSRIDRAQLEVQRPRYEPFEPLPGRPGVAVAA